MKVLRIRTSYKNYGGNMYEDAIVECLKKAGVPVEEDIPLSKKINNKFIQMFFYFYKLFSLKHKSNKFDYTIRALETSLFLSSKTKNIVVAHHFDTSYSNIFSKLIQYSSYIYLLLNKNKVHRLVVVSKYWKSFFEKKGFSNIEIIYNAFDIEKYKRSKLDIENFKKKFGLDKKKILVYIGNPQLKKGTKEVFNILSKYDKYLLITSGVKEIDLDTYHLELTHDDYITMLHSVDVVILNSKFKEGWNRVAHEALLCKTPVIGSGKGGMEELLKGAKQEFIDDINILPEKIDIVLSNYDTYVKNGYEWARKFTFEKFCEDWKKVLCVE